MSQTFTSGDNLIFQLESGYGLLRILTREERDGEIIWHISVAEEFYPDVESAEAALATGATLPVRAPHLALTNYAMEKTPVARLNNRPITDDELAPVREWNERGGTVSNRSALLMLGFLR